MNIAERHEMNLEAKYPTGAEEWLCPTCGRRFLMQWPPKYKRIILDAGDENIAHTASKGGLQIGSIQAKDGGDTNSSDVNLGSWLDGLRGLDLDV